MSSIHNAGFSNNLIYDNCSYQQYLNGNDQQYHYRLSMDPYENINKCRFDKFYHPYDVVSIESILRNQTRPASNCNMFKHNPNNQGKCFSKKEPYTVSSIQSNIYNCPSCNTKLNYDIQQEEVKKNEGIVNNIKNTIGLNNNIENFTPEETYNMFFAMDPSIQNKKQPNPIVENTYCDYDVNTFDKSVPAVCNDCCSIVFNNIPKRYNTYTALPKFIQ